MPVVHNEWGLIGGGAALGQVGVAVLTLSHNIWIPRTGENARLKTAPSIYVLINQPGQLTNQPSSFFEVRIRPIYQLLLHQTQPYPSSILPSMINAKTPDLHYRQQ